MKKKGKLLTALSLSAALALSGGAAVYAGESEAARPASGAAAQTDPAVDTTEEAADSAAAGQDASLADAIDPSTTSAESPAPLGQWVNFAVYSTGDSAYHTLQVKIDKVYTYTDDQEVIDSAIALNNTLNPYRQISIEEQNLPSDVEPALVQYEVNIPADFPAGEFGLSSLDLMLTAQAPDGGGIPAADGSSTYIGLGSSVFLTTDDFGDELVKFQPGNEYKAFSYFDMVKGYKDYVFEAITYPDGTKDPSADSLIYTYFASHEASDTLQSETAASESEAAQSETQMSAQEAADAFQNALNSSN